MCCNNNCGCGCSSAWEGQASDGSFTSYVPVTVNYQIQSGANGNGNIPYGNFSGSCAADYVASVDSDFNNYCGNRSGCGCGCCRRYYW